MCCSGDIFLGFLAILFPPIAVWVKCGICSADSLINILLLLLGYIPGLLHAWYVIAKYPEPEYEYASIPQGHERGGTHVAYVYVQAPSPQPQPSSQPANLNYGTTSTAPPADEEAHVGVPPSYAEAVADNKVQTR